MSLDCFFSSIFISATIRRRSKIPGVMITQFVTNIPEGKSTPDFQCKPTPINTQEGHLAVFKAVVKGDPKPEVSWKRTLGSLSNKDKYKTKYEESTGEHILEIHNVSGADADTYKCYAVNEYGKAVCSATLNVTDGEFLTPMRCSVLADFRKLLRKSKVDKADGENDERFWEAMLNADGRDYEHICSEFGVTDLHLVVKKLEEKKRERAQNNYDKMSQTEKRIIFLAMICSMSTVTLSLLYIQQDDVIPYDDDATLKYNLQKSGRKQDFGSEGLINNMAGLRQGNGMAVSFKNRGLHQDALFECVLTHPLPKITWLGKGIELEDGEKYKITASDHKLIHRLLIRDCVQLDTGIYSAVAGGTSCSAWLVVEDEDDEDNDEPQISTRSGHEGTDLNKNKNFTNSSKHQKKPKKVHWKDASDPGVHFISGLSDVSPTDFSVSKDGSVHTLVILRCTEEHSGKYRFEADVQTRLHSPTNKINLEDLTAFTEPVTVKTGHHAIFKANFVGFKPIKIQWYREGEELLDDASTKIEKSCGHTRLLLSRCHRKDTGEIKLKLKNEHGFTEAVSQLNVLDKPTSPQGPAEVTESSASCIEFRWRPPKDDGGSPVVSYAVERRQVGRNTWKKLGETPGAASYRDTDVEHGRRYCYRVRAATAEGVSEVMETDDMQAAFPGPPAPPKVISAFDDCINLAWTTPSNTGGSRILGYILEKRKKGSNLWTVVNALDEVIKEKKYAVKDVVAGMEYEFRVTAINLSGPGESSNPSEFVFARDPKKPPGKVFGLKVVETSYTHMVLTWTKPEDKPGIQDEARGYFVEIRKADCLEWSRCNSTPMILTSFSAKGLKSMDMYWVRVIAVNDGGESAPEELPNYVLAMPLPVRPKFTNKRMKSFMVVRAGNSVRITVNFEASPRPHITWLKDNAPVTKRVTVSNSDGSSQMLIPSSERSDSGIYSVLVKNLVGQETFSTEVRVTGKPEPPGPVELEENVPDTVTVIWEPSPDEKRDDRLHYLVSKLDSTKRTWTTVADRLFNNKFTICNIVHGREYHFRVYAKNDMGVSAPSESSTWGVQKKKGVKDCDLQCAPTFIVPLKLHTAPKGYECYMSCAVKGNPAPRITWYRNHISINTNTNYYISNTCGVCSMLILRVRPKDMGEYTITAENSLGRAECTTVLRNVDPS
uniref:Immunoglobulin like and fibronectin type III domain containing 1, tandem duplicate 1 n=1 Tax=Salarias fasciatus TaxID=181472 RepID=A0A672J1G3_SALFA